MIVRSKRHTHTHGDTHTHGNRTRAARVAGEHSTTEPPMRTGSDPAYWQTSTSTGGGGASVADVELEAKKAATTTRETLHVDSSVRWSGRSARN